MLYDYDDAGVNGAAKAKEAYSIDTVFIPKHYYDLYKAKDVSDFIKEFGLVKTRELLEELIPQSTKTTIQQNEL